MTKALPPERHVDPFGSGPHRITGSYSEYLRAIVEARDRSAAGGSPAYIFYRHNAQRFNQAGNPTQFTTREVRRSREVVLLAVQRCGTVRS